MKNLIYLAAFVFISTALMSCESANTTVIKNNSAEKLTDVDFQNIVLKGKRRNYFVNHTKREEQCRDKCFRGTT